MGSPGTHSFWSLLLELLRQKVPGGGELSKVLITDRRHPSIAEEKAILEPLGVQITDHFCSSEDELIEYGRGAIGFLVSYAKVTRRVMQALPELKIAVKYGVGYDNLDTVAAAELGVYTVNVPDYCVEEVALQGLSLVLSGLRFTSYFAEEVRKGNWISDPSCMPIHRLSELSVGFIGFGRIAKRLADYLRPMAKVTRFFDPYVEHSDTSIKCASLDELISTCGIVSVHTPLTPDSKGMIGKRQLDVAKGLILINTSRAAVVEKIALTESLKNGSVRFYGADTHWEEPWDVDDPENRDFLAMRNVLITPHMGWYSAESEAEVRRKAAMEVARVIQGECPLHIVL